MKKILYILMLSFITSLSVSSCVEEDVKPMKDDIGNGGGGASDPVK